jgi:ribosomal protein S18 acetylase RimI-like enzyme
VITKPKIQTLDAAEVPAETLAAFFREVWDQRATAESVASAREGAAKRGVEIPTTVVLADARVVGYCSTLPIELWDGRAPQPGYWVKGLMVLPEYRNGPIGFLVLKALVSRLRRSVVLTVARPSVRLFEALGYTNLGTVPNYLCVLRPGRLASKAPTASLEGRIPGFVAKAIQFSQRIGLLALGGGAIGLGLRAAAWISAIPRVGLTVAYSDRLPSCDELDRLWLAARCAGCSGVARNAHYLRHRYRGDRYRFVTVRHRDTLRALAVLRVPREQNDDRVRGLSLGALSDLVVRQGDFRATIAATRGVAALGRRLGGDALLASTPSRWIGRLLGSQTWLPMPGNLRFLLRETDPAHPWPRNLEQWLLMRGDGESDGAL